MRQTTVFLAIALMAAGCSTTTPDTSATASTSAMPAAAPAPGLQAAIDATTRDPANVARDRYRHPRQTLEFFGLQPTQTVIEITPGGGWYTEILAPYLSDGGRYVAATGQAAPDTAGGKRNAALRERLAGFNGASLVEFDPKDPVFGPEGSADLVLTFRNLHNWLAAKTTEEHLRAAWKVLKPGGMLGVVDHRAKPGTDIEVSRKTGYVTEQLVIDLAGEVGFELVARSEVNANPKDTADHPNGVWTLPPTNRHDAKDDTAYQAIGESDRMTLLFRKVE